MKYPKLILCLLIFMVICLFKSKGQTKIIDSLTNAIENASGIQKRAGLYLQRSKSWPVQQYENIIADAQQSFNYFQQLADTSGMINTSMQLANTYTRQNKYGTGIEFDNLALQLAEKKNDTKAIITALAHRGRNYVSLGNVQLAEQDYTQALKLSEKGDFEFETISIYNGLAVLLRQTGKFEESVKNSDKMIALAEKFRLKPTLATALMNKANALSQLARYEEAMAVHLKGLAIKESLNDKIGLLQSYNNIGLILRMMKDYEKSIQYYRKALQISIPLKQYSSIGNNYSNLAISYIDLNKNLDSVPYFFQQAISAFEQNKEQRGLAMSLHNYGNFLLDHKKDYENAEQLLQRALAIRRNLNSSYDLASTMNVLGTLKLKTGHKAEAEQLLLKGLEFLQTENGEKKKDNYLRLARFYKENGDLDKAYQYQAHYAAMQDTLLTEGKIVNALKLQNKYEIEKKNNELALAGKENQLQKIALSKHRLQIWFLAIVLILFLAIIGIVYKNYLAKKHNAEVLVVKNNQIETLVREQHHRVKNNLQVISALLSLQSNKVEDEKAKDALEEGKLRVDAMALIHQKLYLNDNLASIHIGDYVRNLSNALAESYGYKAEVIKTSIDMPDQTFDLDQAIPIGLIINELISNSFKHAFKGQENPEIKISMLQDQVEQTRLIVADNGINVQSEADQTHKSSTSFGLRLIRTLVKQLEGTLDVQQAAGTKYTIVFKNN
ncbi:tetratricopeptide repeat protein [Pedobacter montanisoli]|uniref:histidine kinase n=1 Tax=Pedobacter montanisoli TaxID=2923277 RepID=A0ABS9ZZR6_9SPHI|nr:tetratricopeptide repeat protein [Pedobacter montanisoli]MCJ0743792.1 tetratricopeptide repeat protein [Pedobacter montanisoli]